MGRFFSPFRGHGEKCVFYTSREWVSLMDVPDVIGPYLMEAFFCKRLCKHDVEIRVVHVTFS